MSVGLRVTRVSHRKVSGVGSVECWVELNQQNNWLMTVEETATEVPGKG